MQMTNAGTNSLAAPSRPGRHGLGMFTYIWLGQLVSMTGSALTSFTLGVWVYQQTGSATEFTLIAFCAKLPGLLTLPLAGALADRWNRGRVMILCNVVSALCTLGVVALLASGRLRFWHIYVAVIIITTSDSFLAIAYTAATTLLVPKRHFGRASGMVQGAQATAQIAGPVLAGLLLTLMQVQQILLVDFGTYVLAVVPLLFIRVPGTEADAGGEAAAGSWWRRATYGWRYIRERKGLLGLLVYFAVVNLILGMAIVLFVPMLLNLTSAEIVGRVLSVNGLGLLVGSVVMFVWGGPKRGHVKVILLGGMAFSLMLVLAGVRPSLPLIACAGFGLFFLLPIINGSNQVIWQNKTAPEVQGRVFAVRRMIAVSTTPLAYLLAGPLADKVFEPFAASGSALSLSIGRVIGAGPGRGIGLMFVLAGVLMILLQLATYLQPRLRRLEESLPDVVTDEGGL